MAANLNPNPTSPPISADKKPPPPSSAPAALHRLPPELRIKVYFFLGAFHLLCLSHTHPTFYHDLNSPRLKPLVQSSHFYTHCPPPLVIKPHKDAPTEKPLGRKYCTFRPAEDLKCINCEEARLLTTRNISVLETEKEVVTWNRAYVRGRPEEWGQRTRVACGECRMVMWVNYCYELGTWEEQGISQAGSSAGDTERKIKRTFTAKLSCFHSCVFHVREDGGLVAKNERVELETSDPDWEGIVKREEEVGSPTTHDFL
ncbi:hypothetical protein BJ508DRAFT_363893 [Ascobolus immersus RN42]|uniref:F-box domain-containing protein n=1 Tax=Ascobolus immersus RN42 TaxID=1160509 RepID=A0A3N4I979_ASCIM|nr:hypothetical protein BJ508DRAFT_363893 [Ascobolus immersus RN42]